MRAAINRGMFEHEYAHALDESAASLQLTGAETYHIEGVAISLNGGGRAVKADGTEIAFTAVVRVDTPQEVEY